MKRKIFSKIINTNATDKNIFSIAKQKFVELGEKLLVHKFINKYDIEESNGIKITLYRRSDNKQLIIKIDPDSEVFYRVFDGVYVHVTAEHDMENKLELLDDFLIEAKSWMEKKDYYEEYYEKHGKIIYRRIIFPNGGSESASIVPFGWFRRFFSTKRRIVRPED